VLPKGLQARTKEEAMKKSKEDKQYGNGIQQNKNKPNNLVDSADYWEKRCEFVTLLCIGFRRVHAICTGSLA
jgi:hypothetical protein